MKLEFSRQIVEKSSDINFMKLGLFEPSYFVRTDVQTDMTKLIDAFRNFVCCQVEVSATGWSLVQRSPTDCVVSLCVISKPQEWGG
jgi:hypothetical protein